MEKKGIGVKREWTNTIVGIFENLAKSKRRSAKKHTQKHLTAQTTGIMKVRESTRVKMYIVVVVVGHLVADIWWAHATAKIIQSTLHWVNDTIATSQLFYYVYVYTICTLYIYIIGFLGHN